MPAKKRKWPIFREVLEEALTDSQLKHKMTATIIPTDLAYGSQPDPQEPEKEDFITAR